MTGLVVGDAPRHALVRGARCPQPARVQDRCAPGTFAVVRRGLIERHLDTFRAIAADKATTMGHIQRHHLSEALVALPPRDEIEALKRTYDPLDQLRMSLLAEAERLTAIRDSPASSPAASASRSRTTSTRPVETVLDAA